MLLLPASGKNWMSPACYRNEPVTVPAPERSGKKATALLKLTQRCFRVSVRGAK